MELLRLSFLLAFGLIAVNGLAAPLISELYWSSARERLQAVLRHTAFWLSAYALLVGAGLMFYAELVLSIFGPQYLGARYALQAMTLGQVFSLLTGPVGFLLMMTGHPVFSSNRFMIR